MSDFENGCAGSCDACGSKSDCEKATVTLTLDDGSMMECAILTIFEADEKEYIALLPLDENGQNEDGEVIMGLKDAPSLLKAYDMLGKHLGAYSKDNESKLEGKIEFVWDDGKKQTEKEE